MEKTYKVLLYEYQEDSRFRRMPCRLYTSRELIKLVKTEFDDNVNTIKVFFLSFFLCSGLRQNTLNGVFAPKPLFLFENL